MNYIDYFYTITYLTEKLFGKYGYMYTMTYMTSMICIDYVVNDNCIILHIFAFYFTFFVMNHHLCKERGNNKEARFLEPLN
jgi:hypothetical protein